MKTARKIESFFGVFRVIIAVLIAYMISLIALTVISDEPVMAIRQFIVGSGIWWRWLHCSHLQGFACVLCMP